MTSPSQVQTVRGPVSVDDLGTVLMHEHVFVLSEEFRQSLPETWDEQERVRDAVRRLKDLVATGVTTIVDPTVIGLGRDVGRVALVNEQIDLNIIAATGIYTLGDVPNFFRYHGPGTMLGGTEGMTELFVRELTEGIADTGVKAAFLKCAIEEELTPGVERVMRAVAQAHVRTGAPITVHTDAVARAGLVAQEILRSEGVDLGAVVIGHSGDTDDLDYLHRLIDNGSYVGMDRFGLDILLPGDRRVATVAALAQEGLADRMVLSHDASCHVDWFPAGVREQIAPNWHHTHLHDNVLPAMRRAGVTEEQLTTMLVDNPRRYFSPLGG
ncbi:phosphotriesterase-related protein [Streptomyces sp. NBC_01571]|uniref:phosphotriesterase family protein n=1 Tax=Streptomyces sp. NBC_01571 TaxID=2975883 RepID=UPI0022545EFF|nr:phosphotriesterase-related protein [Streptomyces sp. NBC_01571]MCX4579065.1 phosphotriesterase-related protein [Streptomyces sp. NBC_01571]